jgi:effector-binding domain-containing protein
MSLPISTRSVFFYHDWNREDQTYGLFENGFVVPADTLIPEGKLFVKHAPAEAYVSVLLTGGYNHIGAGWKSLRRQLETQKIDVDWKVFREVYHYMESFDSRENRTEVQVLCR